MAGSGDGTGYSVCYVTFEKEEEGRRLADKMVEQQLAACVNIVPTVESVFTWEGKAQHEKEGLLIIKTRTGLVGELSKFVEKEHSYDCPEVISLPISDGHEPYLKCASPLNLLARRRKRERRDARADGWVK